MCVGPRIQDVRFVNRYLLYIFQTLNLDNINITTTRFDDELRRAIVVLSAFSIALNFGPL